MNAVKSARLIVCMVLIGLGLSGCAAGAARGDLSGGPYYRDNPKSTAFEGWKG